MKINIQVEEITGTDRKAHQRIKIKTEKGQWVLYRDKQDIQIAGIIRAIEEASIKTTGKGYIAKLGLQGIGYYANIDKNKIQLNVGFKDTKRLEIPEGVKIQVVGENKIVGESKNRDKLYKYMDQIKQIRPASKDRYKKRGIYQEEGQPQ